MWVNFDLSENQRRGNCSHYFFTWAACGGVIGLYIFPPPSIRICTLVYLHRENSLSQRANVDAHADLPHSRTRREISSNIDFFANVCGTRMEFIFLIEQNYFSSSSQRNLYESRRQSFSEPSLVRRSRKSQKAHFSWAKLAMGKPIGQCAYKKMILGYFN